MSMVANYVGCDGQTAGRRTAQAMAKAGQVKGLVWLEAWPVDLNREGGANRRRGSWPNRLYTRQTEAMQGISAGAPGKSAKERGRSPARVQDEN